MLNWSTIEWDSFWQQHDCGCFMFECDFITSIDPLVHDYAIYHSLSQKTVLEMLQTHLVAGPDASETIRRQVAFLIYDFHRLSCNCDKCYGDCNATTTGRFKVVDRVLNDHIEFGIMRRQDLIPILHNLET
uniref:p15 n=1 Tax=Citrus leprosis virus C TaxID=347219 RepID=A0A0N9EK90_9VIRU|nr:p15 [Citrus leprosis virus C]